MDAERRAELERRVRWEPDAAEPPIFARWEAGGC
jgi:hypothetical protein